MLTPAQKKALEPKPKRRNKYRAKRVTIDGHTFHSKKEGNRYVDLKILLAAGRISDLKLQPRFALHAVAKDMQWVRIGYYVADFQYLEDGETIIEAVSYTHLTLPTIYSV